ncbi:MAG: hypothetical protein AAB388_00150 [Patescibacteria group bacterium]
MTKNFSKETVGALIVGLLVGGLVGSQLFGLHVPWSKETPHDDEYHIHADFLIYTNGEKVDLALDELMTTAEQELHEFAHLHDSEGEVVHMHAENITLVEFLASLGITITEECLTLRDQTSYCNDGVSTLALYVNGDKQSRITTYVPRDEDRVLLIYGATSEAGLVEYLDAIPSDACLYSGTCPERGIAPPESCGLTCDL